jgi:hypothetical protein
MLMRPTHGEQTVRAHTTSTTQAYGLYSQPEQRCRTNKLGAAERRAV